MFVEHREECNEKWIETFIFPLVDFISFDPEIK